MPMTNLENVLRMLPKSNANIITDAIADAYIADRAPYMSSNAQNLLRNAITSGKYMTNNQKNQLKRYLERELETYNRYLEPVIARYINARNSGNRNRAAAARKTMNAMLNRVNRVGRDGLRAKPGYLPHVNQAGTLMKTRSSRR